MSTLQLCAQSFEQHVGIDPDTHRAAGRVLVTAARDEDEARLFLEQIGLRPIDMDRATSCGHPRYEVRAKSRKFRCLACERVAS